MDCEGADPAAELLARQQMWGAGWRRWLFPALWLIYLVQVLVAVSKYSSGWGVVVGYLVVIVFSVCYVAAIPAGWSHRLRGFWTLYAVICVLTVVETFFARADALTFCVYIAVLTVASRRTFGIWIIAVMTLAALVLPVVIPGWGGDPDYTGALAVVLVSLAMYGFFAIVQSNGQLEQARSEVARLAAENERTRIARDLHDLLGHSLTTITVKAALARRLVERDPQRAAVEIAEVEELTRGSLADVRAAVAGYREVTLAGELTSAREVLRAAGITPDLPRAVDLVDPSLRELFGWVTREGITNVVRHSRATRCTITLGRDWIEIVDDGHGAPGPAGHGLTGLRERVEAANGSVLTDRSGSGWRLRVDVALPSTRSDESSPVNPTVRV